MMKKYSLICIIDHPVNFPLTPANAPAPAHIIVQPIYRPFAPAASAHSSFIDPTLFTLSLMKIPNSQLSS